MATDKSPYQQGYADGRYSHLQIPSLLLRGYTERLDCIAYHLGFTLGQKDKEKHAQAGTS